MPDAGGHHHPGHHGGGPVVSPQAVVGDLTALMALSGARYVTKTLRKQALNEGRAKTGLRVTQAQLDTLRTTAGYITFKDTVNQRWMRVP